MVNNHIHLASFSNLESHSLLDLSNLGFLRYNFLISLQEHAKGGKCIVFTRIKRDADRLAYAVGRRFGCEVLHGDISQSQRERTLVGFQDGCFNILIATDIAARGLDIPNVDLVSIFFLIDLLF